jgi:hypothetical protein
MEQFDSGSLAPLDLSVINQKTEEIWRSWKNAFDIYTQINGITDPIKKKLHLLHKGGLGLQDVYRNLPTSTELISANNDVFQVAIKQLDNFFTTKKVLIRERLKFCSIEQGESTIDEFVLKLRKQANLADLKGETFDFYMIDQISSKCNSKDLKKRLYEKDYTLQEVINMARSDELAQSQMNFNIPAEKPTISETVNKINENPNIVCYRCGNKGHISTDKNCPGRDQYCRTCHTKGHYTKCCRSKRPNKRPREDTEKNINECSKKI